jgi:DNA adenine methylase
MSRPIMRYHGSKWRIAPWIIGHMPPHQAYVEPYGGGASVLLRKPASRLEVYNDLDGQVVNLFQVLRNDPQGLADLIALTPFSRTEFSDAHKTSSDPLEMARQTLIRSHMGHGSNGVHQRTGFRAAGMRASTLPVHNWQQMPDVIAATADRLKSVVIECRPALDVMRANDGATTLHYVDPPYPLSTRDGGKDYNLELTDDEHVELLQGLKDLEGSVILSGYACDLYDDTLTSWHRAEKNTRADGAAERTEVIWMNFDPQAQLGQLELWHPSSSTTKGCE